MPMPFIKWKALKAQTVHMRGYLLTFSVFAAALMPDSAFARESDQGEAAVCTDPKHRHVVLRPLTEPAPVRKLEKVRIRRILM
jgi:hypothetical protein